LKTLANIDIAFIPMNLPYTQTVDAAATWVKDFRPKMVYPYHYGESDVNRFRMLVGAASEVRLRNGIDLTPHRITQRPLSNRKAVVFLTTNASGCCTPSTDAHGETTRHGSMKSRPPLPR